MGFDTIEINLVVFTSVYEISFLSNNFVRNVIIQILVLKKSKHKICAEVEWFKIKANIHKPRKQTGATGSNEAMQGYTKH